MEQGVDEDHAPRAHQEWFHDERAEAFALLLDQFRQDGLDVLFVPGRVGPARLEIKNGREAVKVLDRLARCHLFGDREFPSALAHEKRRGLEPVSPGLVPVDLLVVHIWLGAVHDPDRVAVVAPLQTEDGDGGFAAGAVIFGPAVALTRGTQGHLDGNFHAGAAVVGEEDAREARVLQRREEVVGYVETRLVDGVREHDVSVPSRCVGGRQGDVRVAVAEALCPPRCRGVEQRSQEGIGRCLSGQGCQPFGRTGWGGRQCRV